MCLILLKNVTSNYLWNKCIQSIKKKKRRQFNHFLPLRNTLNLSAVFYLQIHINIISKHILEDPKINTFNLQQ